MERQIVRVKCAAKLSKHPCAHLSSSSDMPKKVFGRLSSAPSRAETDDSAAADDAAAFAHKAHGLANVIIRYARTQRD